MVDSWRFSLVLECGDTVVLTKTWDQNWPQVFSSDFCFWGGLHFLMIFIGEVVDCMGHLVCCEYAGTRHQSWSVAGSFGVCVGGSLTCSGQTRPLVFHLLGRTLKFPRGCLRSPWGRWSWGAEQARRLALKQNSSPVAVLHIGVQGKILFALRGLLLKKEESWKTTD